jgi:polysaccharide export outer membrane protein
VSPAQTGALNANPAGDPATTPVADPVAPIGGGPEVERFRVGSSLTISLLDTPTPIPPFEGKIKEDGTITLTQNQTFKADGKTPGELEKEIRECYVPKYFKRMTVVVRQEATTLWYYVDGEVKQPNRYIHNSRITLLKAITSAGGFTDFANKKKVKLTRVDGRSQTVNCVKARQDPKLDLEVYAGDKIYVPRSIW